MQKSKNPKNPFFSKVQSPKSFFFLIMNKKIKRYFAVFGG